MPQAIPLAIMAVASGIGASQAAKAQKQAAHQYDVGKVDLTNKNFGDAMANQDSGQMQNNISLSPNGPNFTLPQFNRPPMGGVPMLPKNNIRF